MKNVIAIISGIVLAISLGTVFAGNGPTSGAQDMQMPRAASQTPSDPQNACNTKYPSFSQLDTKHKDYLTIKEVTHVPGLKSAFKKADTDHNGKLSQSEYTAWVQSQCRSSMSQQSQGQMTPPPV
ncbi:MAG: EF-hand domain-containing protein [Gammaproteobacteria bacterium]